MSITIGSAGNQLDQIIPALVKARKAIKPATKGGTNTYDRYNYATLEDWHRAVMPALLANGLTLALSVEEVTNLEDRTTKKGGTEHVVQVKGGACLLHESGQCISIMGAGQGQDRADKGIYKAITGMNKYLFACMFALPTTDDPEADETVGETAAARQESDAKLAPEPDVLKLIAEVETGTALSALIKAHALRKTPFMAAAAARMTALGKVAIGQAADLTKLEAIGTALSKCNYLTAEQFAELSQAQGVREKELKPAEVPQ